MVKIGAIGVAIFLAFLNLSPVLASSANISHSFGSEESLKAGSLVSLDNRRQDFVQLANTDNASRLVGVAVATDDSLVALDSDSKRAQVATSGNANVLVSTLNGEIKAGDQIGVSAVNGIGAKAAPGSYVIGVAQSEFNSSTDGSEEQTITDNRGERRSIHVGYVNLNIGVSFIETPEGSQNLTSLQRIGKALTGRVISQARLIISAAIALVSLCAIITLVYASIYGSILSVGRNPLAKDTVFGTLRAVLAMVGAIAVLAVGMVVLILRG